MTRRARPTLELSLLSALFCTATGCAALTSGQASPGSYPTAAPLPTARATATLSAAQLPATPEPAFRPGDPTFTPPGNDIRDPSFQEGVRAYWDHDYETTAAQMEEFIQRHPGHAPAHWYLGMAYWNLDDCRSGLVQIETALRLDPAYGLAWADRGLMHMCLGNDDQALQDLARALALNPSLAKAHERIGTIYFNRGDFVGALEAFDRALAIDPRRSLSWAVRGGALGMLGDQGACIVSETRALAIEPDLWEAYSRRALCSLASDSYEAAVSDYDIYLAHVTDDADAWYNLGIAHRRLASLEKAEAAYTQALQIAPDYYQALINRGYARLDLGRSEQALADFHAALAFGEIPAAYSGRGDAYAELGRLEEAAADYERAILLMPTDSYVYCRLGSVNFELGRHAEAIEAFDLATWFDPECASDQGMLEMAGRSHAALGQHGRAIDCLSRALALRPYTYGYYYRGLAYQAAGMTAEAILDYRTFIDLVSAGRLQGPEVRDAQARLAQLGQLP